MGGGSGATPLDFRAFGIDPSSNDLSALTCETLDMVLRIWDRLEPVTYESKFWKFTIPEPVEDLGFYVHMKPYQKPHPPITTAGISPNSNTLKITGQRDWIPLSANHPANILNTQWEVYSAASREAGHIPNRADWRICRDIFITDTTEEAREIARNDIMARDFITYFRRVMEKLEFLKYLKIDPDTPAEEIKLEYMINKIWIVESPQEVANKIRTLYDDIGGFGVLLTWSHEWEPYDKWIYSITLLVQEVMPSLSDLTPETIE